MVRPVAPPAPAPVDVQPEPGPEPQPEPPAETALKPVLEHLSIEPPSFQLLEPEPFVEREPLRETPLEVENLSILRPAAPEEPEDDQQPYLRIAIAALIFILVCLAAILLR